VATVAAMIAEDLPGAVVEAPFGKQAGRDDHGRRVLAGATARAEAEAEPPAEEFKVRGTRW
jgi:hypothetical protein